MSITGTVPPHITHLNDIDDVNVPSPTDQYFVYWDAATSLWKCKALVDADIPAAICRDTELADHAALPDVHHTKFTITEHDTPTRHPLANLDTLVCSEAEADSKITTHKGDASAHHAVHVKTLADHPLSIIPTMDDDHIPAAIARDTEVDSKVSDHAALTTGVHGVGTSYISLAPTASHLVRTFTKGWTVNKFLQGAGVDTNPTEVDAPAAGDNSPFRYRRASSWHFPSLCRPTEVLTIDANRLYAVPFITAQAITVTKIGIYITSSTAGNARLGIYSDDGTIYPGALVSDCGTIDTSAIIAAEITGLSISLSANSLYWLVLVGNATPTFRAYNITSSDMCILGSVSSAAHTIRMMWHVAYTYAALPANFPADATLSSYNPLAIGVYF